MFKNYWKIAIRNLLRNPLSSGISILGLATGIVCCLLIVLYVFHETSYDKFHKNADRIVRATMELSYSGTTTKVPVTGTKVLPEFKRVFPEVENGTRLFPTNTVVQYGDKIFREKGFVYTDTAFLNIFSFKILQGNPLHLLDKPNQIVLTRTTARKYFGNEIDAPGKSLRINNDKAYVVSGIIEDCPSNSQIKFDLLASWSSLTDPVYTEESWMDASHYTYLLLKKPGMYETLEQKIPTYFKSQDKDFGVSGKNYLNIRIQLLKDVHLRAIVEGGLEPGGDYRYVYIFSIVAILILVIACANYVNLTTARAAERAKEVGVRKVSGANRSQLFSQFMGESFVTVLISLLISIAISILALPLFNRISEKQFSLVALFSPSAIIVLVILLLSIGIAGSIYPAMILSGFNPIKVLKGNLKSGASGIRLRKTLIVLQFFISVVLIVSTLVIYNQLSFIQHKKLGYNNEHVLMLNADKTALGKKETFKSELSSNPGILNVSTCNQSPTFIAGRYNLSLNDKEILFAGVRVERDFIKTMGLQIKNGVDFTLAEELAAFANTDTIQRPAILNETAVRELGWTNEEAIGKAVSFQGRNTIVKAVVADFHFSSMHEAIGPFIIFLSSNTSKLLVKLSGEQLEKNIRYIQEKWNAIAPHLPFEYEFLDDQFNKLYSTETRTGRIFYTFALLSIILACLGLFGLATFTAQQRTKEIGVRKVLGASITGIVVLLSKDFLKLVFVATFIALPLSWWMMNKWLDDFAYRISISWWMPLLAGVIAAGIALITVGLQAIKAAIANPVESLRTE